MLVTERTREILAYRRARQHEERELTALGYRKHETDWELHRGYAYRRKIVDAKISFDGKYVWTLIGPEPASPPSPPDVVSE